MKVEAALEQVRSRAMAMRQSSELQDVVIVVLEKLKSLDIPLISISINIVIDGSKDLYVYACGENEGGLVVACFRNPYFDHCIVNDPLNAWEKGLDFFSKKYTVEEKNSFYEYLFEHSDLKNLPVGVKEFIRQSKSYTFSMAPAKNSAIVINDFDGKTLSEKEREILKRFAKVFEQAYIRFLDLQKAEAQAREAQIELSLEHVRAKTMAMHNSQDVGETVATMFDELVKLGIEKTARCGIAIINDNMKMELWRASYNADGNVDRVIGRVDMTIHPLLEGVHQAWKNNESVFSWELTGNDQQEYFRALSDWPEYPVQFDLASLPAKQSSNSFFFPEGCVYVFTIEPLSSETVKLFKRFAGVFGQTYRRYLDLQKAEAQAKEAQIQLALERIRARTMAMQHSDELTETVSVVFKQLLGLGIPTEQIRTCGIVTFDAKEPIGEQWVTEMNGDIIPRSFMVPYHEAPAYKTIYKWWKNGEEFKVNHLEGEALQGHLTYLAKYTKVPQSVLTEESHEIYNHILFFSQGYLFIITRAAMTEYHDVFKRFGAVFQQSYTRFQDLEKGEAQAREAQIETALEKVRSRSLAMHYTHELNEVIAVVFEKINELAIATGEMDAVSILIPEDGSKEFTQWIANQVQAYPLGYHLPYVDNPVLSDLWDARASEIDYVAHAYSAKVTKAWFKAAFKYTDYKYFPDAIKNILLNLNSISSCCAFEQHTAIQISGASGTILSKTESEILKRFARVFEQAYVRFLDLQKAEEQTRESQIQLALERVRARTAAMQKSEELHEVIQLVFDQLQQLNFNIDVANFALNYKETDDFDLVLAVPDGKYPMEIHVPYFKHPVFDRFNKAKKKRNLLIDTLTKDQKDSFFEHFFKYAPGVSEETKASIFGRPGFVRSSVLMRITALTIHNYDGIPYSEAENNTLLRFGQVFEQTYTRFKDLEQAEEQVREAKIEASLERVRGRTMAMQHSDELRDVIQVIYEQLHQLNFNIDSADFNLDYHDTDDFNLWVGVPGRPYPAKMHIPYIDHPLFNRIVKTKGKVPAVIADCYPSKQKNTYFRHIFKFSPTPIPAERQNFIFSGAGLAISTVLMTNVALSALNYSGVPYTDADNATLMRFGKVFEQTYTRFKDLEQAEAQAREAQIQLGLERVRARAMAMQSSDELAEVVDIVFKELTKLDFGLTHCAIAIADADSVGLTLWQANSEPDQPPISFYRKSFDHPYPNAAYKEWKKRTPKWVYHLKGAEKKAMHDYYASSQETMNVPNAVKEGMAAFDSIILSHSFNNFGYLRTDTTDALSEDNLDTVYRFAKAFDLCYTRFTDIKQAEAQAREAQIQLALERVRARTMAMQKSDELPETSSLLFQQVKELGETAIQNSIAIVNEETGFVELSTTIHGSHLLHTLNVPIDDPYLMAKGVAAWKEKRKSLTVEIGGQELKDYNELRNSFLETKINFPEDQWIVNISFFSKGWLSFSSNKNVSSEIIAAQKRFADVFGQTYTRFLDLQKAEAQSREAQIELGLERVRARTMAMQKSEELRDVIQVIYEQLVLLNFEIHNAGFIMDYKLSDDCNIWSADSRTEFPVKVHIPYADNPYFKRYKEAKEQGLDFYAWSLNFEEKNTWFKHVFQYIDVPREFREVAYGFPGLATSIVFLKNVALYFLDYEGTPYSDAENAILKRFGAVFEQTYTRFTDLKQAEEQAREAKIEAALERVRSKTMAMHSSQDVADTVSAMFDEVLKLGIEQVRCGIGILDKETMQMEAWTAYSRPDSKVALIIGELDMNSHQMLQGVIKSWINKEAHSSYMLTGEDQKDYYRAINKAPGYPTKFDLRSLPEKQFQNAFYFREGFIYVFSHDQISPEAVQIFKRFAGAFGLTYRRFLDLQKAEKQTRDAQIELGLERVRAKAMSMQTSEGLNDLIGTVFSELTKLDFVLTRCLIMIFDQETKASRWWMANSEAPAEPMNYLVQNHKNPAYDAYLKAWKERNLKWRYALKGKVKRDWDDFLFRDTELSQMPAPVIEGMKAPEQFLLSASFNNFGCLTLASLEPLSDEHSDIMLRFAKVFDMCYTRFNDLKQAEAQAKEAQIQLALERVRARTMAMQTSNELAETAAVLFQQFYALGVAPDRVFIAIFREESYEMECWTTDQTGSIVSNRFMASLRQYSFAKMYKAWKSQKTSFILVQTGKELSDYINYLRDEIGVPFRKDIKIEQRIQNVAFFSKGLIGITTPDMQLPEMIGLLERFATVFDLSYTRFNDLKLAEEQARESKIEASLERVRGKAMAMHNSTDLTATASMVFTELGKLGINPIRCGVGLLTKDSRKALLYSATTSKDSDALALIGWVVLSGHPVLNGGI